MWDAGLTAGSWNYTETKRLPAGPATTSCAAASWVATQHEKTPKHPAGFITRQHPAGIWTLSFVFFSFFSFFFDLPPEETRKVTSACLFRYSFIYISPPLDCSFHTVMRLLANGKIQRGDPLFFSFMISPANIFLYAPETFRLCIKKIWKEKKIEDSNSLSQCYLLTIPPHHLHGVRLYLPLLLFDRSSGRLYLRREVMQKHTT